MSSARTAWAYWLGPQPLAHVKSQHVQRAGEPLDLIGGEGRCCMGAPMAVEKRDSNPDVRHLLLL